MLNVEVGQVLSDKCRVTVEREVEARAREVDERLRLR